MSASALYIFIDESGNFDFSPSGTKNFVLTAVSSLSPLKYRGSFQEFKYQLLCSGVDEECFHATEDTQLVRDNVYGLIHVLGDLHIDSVIAQKNKANPSLYTEYHEKTGKIIKTSSGVEFYRIVCQNLLQYILRRYDRSNIQKIVIVLDALFTHNKKQLILKSLKVYLKKHFGKPCYVYFHQSKSDINCQIADYCGWALYVKHERQEPRPYKQIQDKIISEFLIFGRGRTEYYEYKN